VGYWQNFAPKWTKIHMQHFGASQTLKREQIRIKHVGNNRCDIIVTPLLFLYTSPITLAGQGECTDA